MCFLMQYLFLIHSDYILVTDLAFTYTLVLYDHETFTFLQKLFLFFSPTNPGHKCLGYCSEQRGPHHLQCRPVFIVNQWGCCFQGFQQASLLLQLKLHIPTNRDCPLKKKP